MARIGAAAESGPPAPPESGVRVSAVAARRVFAVHGCRCRLCEDERLAARVIADLADEEDG